jgi:type VI protein secretion system component VasK
MGEVKILEFTVNAKQIIMLIWSLIAIVLSLVIVFNYGTLFGVSLTWPVLLALFFGLLLVIILPVYLFMVLWQVLSKSDAA